MTIQLGIAIWGAATGTLACIKGVNDLYHDRARLLTSSKFFSYGEHGGRGFTVKAVNIGRRPIILTQLTLKYEDGSQGGRVLGHPDGLTLKEQEHYECSFEDGDNSLHRPEEGVSAIDFWFVDTQGRKHKVKDSKKTLERVWAKPEQTKTT